MFFFSPVFTEIRINLYIAEKKGAATPRIEHVFDPLAGPDSHAGAMDGRAYLAYLSESATEALKAHTSAELARIQREIAGLTGEDGTVSSLPQAFHALADFEASRLRREKALLPAGTLTKMEADLQYAIAVLKYISLGFAISYLPFPIRNSRQSIFVDGKWKIGNGKS